MRKKMMIIACVLSIVAVSCSNDHNNENTIPPETTGTKYLTTISDSISAANLYNVIAYDNDMNFKSYTNFSGGSKSGNPFVTTLQYTNNKPTAILTGAKTDGSDATVLYELQNNTTGQIEKVVQKKNLLSNVKQDSLVYNKEGYITEIYHYGENGIDDVKWLTSIEKFTWENKNLVKVEEELWQLGVKLSQNYVTTYSYDEKINPHKTVPQIAALYSQMETGPYLYGKLPYYAFASQNNPLIITSTFYTFEPGTGMTGSSAKLTYKYTYTEDNYPLTRYYEYTATEGNDPVEIVTQKYSYTIK